MRRFRTDSEHHGMEEAKDGEYILLKELIEELEAVLGDYRKYPEDVQDDLYIFITNLKKFEA